MSDDPYDDVEPGWDWLTGSERLPEPDAFYARKARENSPAAVFGEMGLVLAVTLGIALLINVLLVLFHVA
jgi:hypothetical protein